MASTARHRARHTAKALEHAAWLRTNRFWLQVSVQSLPGYLSQMVAPHTAELALQEVRAQPLPGRGAKTPFLSFFYGRALSASAAVHRCTLRPLLLQIHGFQLQFLRLFLLRGHIL